MFGKLNKICSKDTYYFTNTSSIPIHTLDRNVELNGRILGFHFYNPPAVQKLLEIIPAENSKKELTDLGMELGKFLEKKRVQSNDIAGFIGNGHFMRDILYACSCVSELSKTYSLPESMYMINKVSQDFMIRPMGIWELIDYVGVDVVQKVFTVMGNYIKGETFHHELITHCMNAKIYGGQDAHGFHKDGIFKYKNDKPIALFSLEEKKYISFTEGNWISKCDEKLGHLPSLHQSWKIIVKDKNKNEKLKNYFKELLSQKTLGAELATKYLFHSKKIAQKLVETKVAKSIDDVNTVLEHGFFHAYGPCNNYY